MFYLIMAAFWFVAGLLLIVWQWLHPEHAFFTIWGSGVSFGWFAMVLALYNLVRWYSVRSNARQRNATRVWEHRRSSARRAEESSELRPDPNVDFTKEQTPPRGSSRLEMSCLA